MGIGRETAIAVINDLKPEHSDSETLWKVGIGILALLGLMLDQLTELNEKTPDQT